MPTYTDMTKCDGCGECVDICPSDIMHIDPVYRRSYNIEPNFCWECYSCVKACPQHAIDVRGYADFAPLGHKVRVLREEQKGSISWKIRYRDGRLKEFTFPIRTTPCMPAACDRRSRICGLRPSGPQCPGASGRGQGDHFMEA